MKKTKTHKKTKTEKDTLAKHSTNKTNGKSRENITVQCYKRYVCEEQKQKPNDSWCRSEKESDTYKLPAHKEIFNTNNQFSMAPTRKTTDIRNDDNIDVDDDDNDNDDEDEFGQPLISLPQICLAMV